MSQKFNFGHRLDQFTVQTGFLKIISQQHNDTSFLDWLYYVLLVFQNRIGHLAGALIWTEQVGAQCLPPPKKTLLLMETGIKATTFLLELCLSDNLATLLGLRRADNGNWVTCNMEKKKKGHKFALTLWVVVKVGGVAQFADWWTLIHAEISEYLFQHNNRSFWQLTQWKRIA